MGRGRSDADSGAARAAPAAAVVPAAAVGPSSGGAGGSSVGVRVSPGGPAGSVGHARRLLLEVPPALLAVIAEGAWIAVPYTLMQTARGEAVVLGPLSLAAFAAAGLVVARLFAERLAGRWAWAIVGLMVVAGIGGWLVAEPVRRALAGSAAFAALALHQGGFLAGLALLRGASHAVPAASERSLARLLAWGTPALAIPLLGAQALNEPARSGFEAQALVACLTFVLAATLGLALARVANLGRAAGFGWHQNRVWLLVAALAAVVAFIALPLAFLVGPAVRLTVALTLPPLILIALIASVPHVTLRSVAIVAFVGLVVFVLSRLVLNLAPNLSPADVPPAAAGANGQDPAATVLTWLPILAIAAILVVFLVRRWLRRRPTAAPRGVFERRWTEPAAASGSVFGGLRWPWARHSRPGQPANAIEAYLATLADMDRLPDMARSLTETPAAHAHRLRSRGDGTRELELLAADYQLARFGAARLTAAEERRAVGRWRRLRERLRA